MFELGSSLGNSRQMACPVTKETRQVLLVMRPKYSTRTRFVSWLQMPWLLSRLSAISVLIIIMWDKWIFACYKKISTTRTISITRDDKKFKYIFIFPQIMVNILEGTYIGVTLLNKRSCRDVSFVCWKNPNSLASEFIFPVLLPVFFNMQTICGHQGQCHNQY